VPKLDKKALDPRSSSGETSATIRARVTAAYTRQLKRAGKSNAELSAPEVEQHCRVNPGDMQLLELAMDKLQLSARAYHRILKLARTIADLADSDDINTAHLSEAISYRSLDRFNPA
jgi:magnesium chelatase family protein